MTASMSMRRIADTETVDLLLPRSTLLRSNLLKSTVADLTLAAAIDPSSSPNEGPIPATCLGGPSKDQLPSIWRPSCAIAFW